MASNSKIFGISLAAVAALWLISRSKNIKDSLKFLQYQVSDLKFRMAGKALLPEILFTVNVFNPNGVAIPVNNFYGQIKRGTDVLASFSNTQPIVILERKHQDVNMIARIKALTVIMAITQLIRKDKQVPVIIEGVIETPFFNMPINETVSLSFFNSLAGMQGYQHKATLAGSEI